MRKLLLVFRSCMLAAGSTACATKKFVRGEVGQVNTKVDGLSTQLEETQERTKKNEGTIGEVDQKATPPVSRRRPRRRPPMRQGRCRQGRRARRGGRDRQPPAGLRSRPERGPGQLQVRQDRAARSGQAAHRPDGHRPEGRSEGRLHRARGPHGQRRLEDYNTSSVSSAPKP